MLHCSTLHCPISRNRLYLISNNRKVGLISILHLLVFILTVLPAKPFQINPLSYLLLPHLSAICIRVLWSVIASTSTRHFHINTFRHPKLTSDELQFGTRLGFDSWADTSCFDSWADTSCTGKHAYVQTFVDGKTINANGFSPSLRQISNLLIAHVVYAYDMLDGSTLLLENF